MKIPESLPYLPDHQHESSAIKKTLKRSNSLSKIESQTETDISFLNTTHAFDRPSLKSLVENKNIIIVSNRGLSSINNTLSALPGGLATAVIDSLYSISKAQDGNQSASWISWDGKNNQTQTGVAVHYPPGEGTNSHPFNVHQFSIEKDLLDTFYRVVNNQTLFPALHSDPADSEYTRSIIPCSNADWDKYEEVNGLFAQYAFNCLSPGKENLVWFQDSQIMMAPKKLRTLIENSDIQDLLKDTKIGYFHHMTWPDKQSLINCLISRDEVWGKDLGTGLRRAVALANTLLQCDALGFHIPKDAKNFVSLIEDEQVNHHLKDLNDAFSIRFDGSNNTITIAYNNVHKNYHEVKIEAHPIGITANNDNIDLGKTESTADAKHEIISQLTTRWKEGNELGINDQTKDVFLDPNTLIFYSIERHEPNKNTNLRIDAIEKYLETSMPKNKIIFMMTLAPTKKSR
ncbi:MAG: trehalose-6-phosphate synthase [Gammaproteobacteria bacterium]